jgi:hypothetical protein
MPSGYCPELDVSDYCTEEEAEYYKQQIGVLRWAVELCRIDITCEVSMLAAFTAAPRQGHLQAVYHMFAYLHQHSHTKLVLDDSYVQIQDEVEHDWTSFYQEAKEDIPRCQKPVDTKFRLLLSWMLIMQVIPSRVILVQVFSYISIDHLFYGTVRNRIVSKHPPLGRNFLSSGRQWG